MAKKIKIPFGLSLWYWKPVSYFIVHRVRGRAIFFTEICRMTNTKIQTYAMSYNEIKSTDNISYAEIKATEPDTTIGYCNILNELRRLVWEEIYGNT